MKYITFAIMIVLIFGMTTAPVLQNGLVFAQTNANAEETEQTNTNTEDTQDTQTNANTEDTQDTQTNANTEDTEATEQTNANTEDTQATQTNTNTEDTQATQTNTNTEDTQATQTNAIAETKRITAEERQEQRRAELLDRERMQERLDAMNNRSPMTEAMDRLAGAGVLDEVNSSDTSTETTTDTTGTYFDNLREIISEQKRSQDMLFSQITMLLNLIDSLCEDKVLVAGISDGILRCIDSESAFNLHSRGLVTLVQ